jgi:hypothetical protein
VQCVLTRQQRSGTRYLPSFPDFPTAELVAQREGLRDGNRDAVIFDPRHAINKDRERWGVVRFTQLNKFRIARGQAQPGAKSGRRRERGKQDCRQRGASHESSDHEPSERTLPRSASLQPRSGQEPCTCRAAEGE